MLDHALWKSARRVISFLLILSLAFGPNFSYAQSAFVAMLPEPGKMVGVSPVFTPVLVKGLVVHPDKPLDFDFIVDSGDGPAEEAVVKAQSEKIVRYFLAALTVPEEQLWVNLSPYEKDRIIDQGLGQTVLGRDMLAQDYVLKQLTASLIYPEDNLGKDFWARIYKEAQDKFGTTDIPVDTFNKVWIVPQKAVVFEKDNAVYVTEARLKVMLDSDYVAMQNNVIPAPEGQEVQAPAELSKALIREVILPAIEKEVNEGRNFVPLRQIYHAAILAKWYRELVQDTLMSKAYVGQNKISGVNSNEKTIKEQIYQRYIAAYKQGVFNYIKDEADAVTGETAPRKYFSGGISDFAMKDLELERTSDASMLTSIGRLFRSIFSLAPNRPRSELKRGKEKEEPAHQGADAAPLRVGRIEDPVILIASGEESNSYDGASGFHMAGYEIGIVARSEALEKQGRIATYLIGGQATYGYRELTPEERVQWEQNLKGQGSPISSQNADPGISGDLVARADIAESGIIEPVLTQGSLSGPSTDSPKAAFVVRSRLVASAQILGEKLAEAMRKAAPTGTLENEIRSVAQRYGDFYQRAHAIWEQGQDILVKLNEVQAPDYEYYNGWPAETGTYHDVYYFSVSAYPQENKSDASMLQETSAAFLLDANIDMVNEVIGWVQAHPVLTFMAIGAGVAFFWDYVKKQNNKYRLIAGLKLDPRVKRLIKRNVQPLELVFMENVIHKVRRNRGMRIITGPEYMYSSQDFDDIIQDEVVYRGDGTEESLGYEKVVLSQNGPYSMGDWDETTIEYRTARAVNTDKFHAFVRSLTKENAEQKIKAVLISGQGGLSIEGVSSVLTEKKDPAIVGQEKRLKKGRLLSYYLDARNQRNVLSVGMGYETSDADIFAVYEDGTEEYLGVGSDGNNGPQWNGPVPERYADAGESKDLGGIDIQNIDVNKTGNARIKFNDDALKQVLSGGFDGFTPVFLRMAPLDNPLMIFGGTGSPREEAKV